MPIFPKAPLLRKWRRKLMWMGIISIAPELGVAIAVQQWVEATGASKRTGCTMAQAFFANMGGLILREVVEGGLADNTSQPAAEPEVQPESEDVKKIPAVAVKPAHQWTDYLAIPGKMHFCHWLLNHCFV